MTHANTNNEPEIQALPAGMRRTLLELLSLGYAPQDAQANLQDAPDGAIAWQVQSMLDDYADWNARVRVFRAANDNRAVTASPAANDNPAEVA